MNRLDEVTIDFTYDTYTDLGQGHIEKEKARVTLHLDDQAKQQIKDLIRHDIIKAYSSYPSHYKIEDVLYDQLQRVDEL